MNQQYSLLNDVSNNGFRRSLSFDSVNQNNNNNNSFHHHTSSSPPCSTSSPSNNMLKQQQQPFTFQQSSSSSIANQQSNIAQQQQAFNHLNNTRLLQQQLNNPSMSLSPHSLQQQQQSPDQANFQALINIVIQQPTENMRMINNTNNHDIMIDSSSHIPNEYENYQHNKMQIDDITCSPVATSPHDHNNNINNNTCNNSDNNGTFVLQEESMDDLLEEGLRKYRHVRKARSLDESSSSFTNLMLQTAKLQLPINNRNFQIDEQLSPNTNMLDQDLNLAFNNSSSPIITTSPVLANNNSMQNANQNDFSQILQQQRLLISQNQVSKTHLHPSQSYRRNSMFEMTQTNTTLSTFNNFHLGSIPSPDNNNNTNMQYQGSDSDSSSNFQVTTPSISVTNVSNNNTGKKKRITITNSNVPQAFDFNQRRNSSSSNSSVTFNTNEYQDFYHGIHETQQKDKKRKALKFTEFTPNNIKR